MLRSGRAARTLDELHPNWQMALAPSGGRYCLLPRVGGAVSFLGVDGSLSTRSSGLQARIDANKDQQARLEDRVSAFETRVRAQYTALDQQMGQMSGLSSYLTQQMTLLGRNLG